MKNMWPEKKLMKNQRFFTLWHCFFARHGRRDECVLSPADKHEGEWL
jgi:hypothetical protein